MRMRWLAVPLLLASTSALAAPKTVVTLDDGWQARLAPGDPAAAAHARETRWFGARVPGSIQQDLIATHRVPDPFKGMNEGAIQWVGRADWEYRRTFDVTPALMARDHLDLVFAGLDTFATVSINGQTVLKADNAHRSWRIDAKPYLKAGANSIVVRFAAPIRTLQPMVLAQAHSLPGEYDSAFGDEPKGRQTSPYIRKPKYNYGWDWGPRILTVGLWQPVRLEAWDSARIEGFRIDQDALNDAEARLSAKAEVRADRAGAATVRVTLTAPDGTRQQVSSPVMLAAGLNHVTLPIAVAHPQRWQPAGYGTQPLYTAQATLEQDGATTDTAGRRIGLRTVELIRGGGAMGFRVNGIPIFAKGANLIPFDSFPARVTNDTMRGLLDDARAANMNMLRVWGGGTYLDDAFYDMADERGLMIWQDFMFGGAVTPPDAAFRANVAAEANEQVERLGDHPAIVLWSGGNEVLSGWQNWSDRIAFKKAIGPDAQEEIGTGMAVLFGQVLRDAVRDHAPGTPYWPGSPSTDFDGPVDTDAAGDRHFWDVWSGSKPVERYLDTCPRFMSEFGFQAMPVMATVRGFAGDGALTPTSPVLKAHQKFLAGEGNDRLLFYLRERLGEPKDIGDFIYLTQVNQAQAIAMAALHHRACRPVTMGSLYWQLNDVWPAISWASVDHAGRWKLLQYAARRFFAPQAVVAEHRDAATRVALVSDATTALPAHWRIRGFDMAGGALGLREGDVTLAPLSAATIAIVADADVFGTADPAHSYAVAELLIDGKPVSRAIVERALPKAMAYPDPGLTVRWQGKQATVATRAFARAVMLDFGATAAQPSDNGFDLLPGESRTVTVASDATPAQLMRALTLPFAGVAPMIWFLLAAAAADPVAATIATMTPEEKAAQLQSSAPADAKAGLPAYDWWNEGLHGLARNGQATVFPQAIGMAATWDADLVHREGDVVATEARARFNAQAVGADRRLYEGLTIWSPNINIFRDPRWGRGQETYGEDPVLTGTLGVAFITGLQGPDPAHPKVIATPKHFAVHSGPEAGRDGFDVDPSPQDLEATYFPAFRMAITQGHAGSLMCAYNAIHGVPACANSPLLQDRLRKDWGFTGFTVSDCDAVSNIDAFHHYRITGAGAAAAALRGGTDINCGTTYAALPQALAQGLVTGAEIDGALTRAFAARRALGIAFGADSPWRRIAADQVATPAHHAVALEAARKAIVLLKNDAGRLPLAAGSRIAVIGADADDLGMLQGNYHGTAVAPVTPLDGIRQAFGAANVVYAQGGVLADGAPVVVPETALRSGDAAGLKAEYFSSLDLTGTPIATRRERRVDLDINRAAPVVGLGAQWSARWSGTFVPPGAGSYALAVDVPACWKYCKSHDTVRLWIDGRPVSAGEVVKGRVAVSYVSDGRPVAFRLELEHRSEDEGVRLLWSPPAQPLLDEAVAAARASDVVVAVLGLSPDLEGEALALSVPGFVGGDRTDIALPPAQQRLLAALKATGKPIVLVLTSGSAVAVDPTAADAILAAWYPGEAGGTAIADTLIGRNNPSGRLPVTFYEQTSDLPAFVDYGMKERTYRYFTGTPLWPFGHGLSYTRFGYTARGGALTVVAGQSLTVSARITNQGARGGDEVAQAYLVPPAAAPGGMTAPVLQRALVGFERIALKPGASGAVSFTLDPRLMSSVARDGARAVMPGAYRLFVGGGQPGDAPGVWYDLAITGAAVALPK